MNNDELIVFNYLLLNHGTNIKFEPNSNKSPDFLLNSNIAIEVRRLNQNFFFKGKVKGLETLSFQLNGAFNEVLSSFDNFYSGESYWVFLLYQRPLLISIKSAKNQMQTALSKFICDSNINFPYQIEINNNLILEINEAPPFEGRFFMPGVSDDNDAGGGVISTNIENIQYCIKEKSEKIKCERYKYDFWHLYLVDHLDWGLDSQEINEVKNFIKDPQAFDRIVIVNRDGKLIFEIR